MQNAHLLTVCIFWRITLSVLILKFFLTHKKQSSVGTPALGSCWAGLGWVLWADQWVSSDLHRSEQQVQWPAFKVNWGEEPYGPFCHLLIV